MPTSAEHTELAEARKILHSLLHPGRVTLPPGYVAALRVVLDAPARSTSDRGATPAEHYAETERLLDLSMNDIPSEESDALVRVAQVHATLATAPAPAPEADPDPLGLFDSDSPDRLGRAVVLLGGVLDGDLGVPSIRAALQLLRAHMES
jgi:hypothetical protein